MKANVCIARAKKKQKAANISPHYLFIERVSTRLLEMLQLSAGSFKVVKTKATLFLLGFPQCSDPESDLAKNEKKDIKRGDLFGSAESTPEVLRDSFPISHCSLELLLRISSGIERLIYLDSLRRLVRDGNFASWT